VKWVYYLVANVAVYKRCPTQLSCNCVTSLSIRSNSGATLWRMCVTEYVQKWTCISDKICRLRRRKGPNLWNTLPEDLHLTQSMNTF